MARKVRVKTAKGLTPTQKLQDEVLMLRNRLQIAENEIRQVQLELQQTQKFAGQLQKLLQVNAGYVEAQCHGVTELAGSLYRTTAIIAGRDGQRLATTVAMSRRDTDGERE